MSADEPSDSRQPMLPDEVRGMFLRGPAAGPPQARASAMGQRGAGSSRAEGPAEHPGRGCAPPGTAQVLRTCPVCGADLFERTRDVCCAVCGNPLRVAPDFPGGPHLCSERCLQLYLLQNVKTCDQCGMRFTGGAAGEFSIAEARADGNGGKALEFCSARCLEKYALTNETP